MTNQKTNELRPKLLGPNALNPFQGNTSSARGAMFATHLGQMLVLNGSQPRVIQTGMEREYGKYTFKVEMPETGVILDIIPRYQQTVGQDSIPGNPQTIVVYESVATKEIGIINLTDYSCNHQYFGFRYKEQRGLSEIRVGNTIQKGTIFLNSPSVSDEGDYKYGVVANVAYMTHPATSEDGILISEDFLPKLGFRTYETRTVDWGRNGFALNLYGDADNYKPFPELGQAVRADGILMAVRTHEHSVLAPVERSVADCMQVHHNFDKTTYAAPGGRIKDIKIHHHHQDTNIAPIHTDTLVQRYDQAYRVFCKKVVDVWRKYHRMRGQALQITPEFHNLVVQAQSVCSDDGEHKIAKIFHKAPLNTFRAEFVIEYDIIPTTGFKLTDGFGG